MTKKKLKTTPTKKPFAEGKDLYEATGFSFQVYIEAALWSARAKGLPLAEVKEFIKHMVSDHIVQELGYDPN